VLQQEKPQSEPEPHHDDPAQPQSDSQDPCATKDVAADLPQQDDTKVVTRRMQFRAKAAAKEKRHAKKEAKAADKQKKLELKVEKARAKDAKKQAAEEQKKMKKQAKAEAAKEKALGNKRKQKHTKSEGPPHKKAPAQKKTSLKKVRTKKRAQSKTFASNMIDDQADNHQHHDALDVSGDKCEAITMELPCSPKKTRLKPAKHSKLSRLQNAMKRKKQAMKKPQRQRGSSKKQGTRSQQPSGASTDASISKTPAKRDANGNNKGKKSKGKEKQPPVDEYVQLITGVLKECHASHCTHPAWEPLEYDAKTIQLSVYWSRNAVGVKVPKAYLPTSTCKKTKGTAKNSSKASKHKMTQVAYFANPTSCVYSNMVCAHVFVIASVFPLQELCSFLQEGHSY